MIVFQNVGNNINMNIFWCFHILIVQNHSSKIRKKSLFSFCHNGCGSFIAIVVSHTSRPVRSKHRDVFRQTSCNQLMRVFQQPFRIDDPEKRLKFLLDAGSSPAWRQKDFSRDSHNSKTRDFEHLFWYPSSLFNKQSYLKCTLSLDSLEFVYRNYGFKSNIESISWSWVIVELCWDLFRKP